MSCLMPRVANGSSSYVRKAGVCRCAYVEMVGRCSLNGGPWLVMNVRALWEGGRVSSAWVPLFPVPWPSQMRASSASIEGPETSLKWSHTHYCTTDTDSRIDRLGTRNFHLGFMTSYDYKPSRKTVYCKEIGRMLLFFIPAVTPSRSLLTSISLDSEFSQNCNHSSLF